MALLLSCSKWVPTVVCPWGGARWAMLPPNVVAMTRGPRHGVHLALYSIGRMALARMALPPIARATPHGHTQTTAPTLSSQILDCTEKKTNMEVDKNANQP